MSDFAQRVKQLRENAEISQKRFAEMLGLTENAYQLYEYGKGYPTFKRLIMIADYFNVSLDYLVGRSDVKERR